MSSILLLVMIFILFAINTYYDIVNVNIISNICALSLIKNIIAIVVYYEYAALQSIAMEEHYLIEDIMK